MPFYVRIDMFLCWLTNKGGENEAGNGEAKQGSFTILNKIKSAVLVLFRLIQENSTNQIAYKQQKFISYSSGVWKVQDQGTRMLCFGKNIFLVHSQYLFTVSSHCGRTQVALWDLFYRNHNPNHEGSSEPNHCPKVPLTNTIISNIRISTYEFQRGHKDLDHSSCKDNSKYS